MVSIFFIWEQFVFFINFNIFFILCRTFSLLNLLILRNFLLTGNFQIIFFILNLDLCRFLLLFWLNILRNLNYGFINLNFLRFFIDFWYLLRIAYFLQYHVYLVVHFIYFFFDTWLLKLNYILISFRFLFNYHRFLLMNLFWLLESMHFLSMVTLNSCKML